MTKQNLKRHRTKTALLTSLLSLLLCVTMLIGTTFAWFTDSVTSGENKIIAGNLDVEVYYAKESDVADGAIAEAAWKNLADSKDLFTGALWEPGHTEVVYLKIVNKGTLALNYKVNVSPVSETGGINVKGENFKLSDYLYFGTTAGNAALTTYSADDDGRTLARAVATDLNGLETSLSDIQKTGTLYGTGDNTDGHDHEHYTALVVYMPENVGNDANYKTGTKAPEITLGITVNATQYTYENDSFNNDYDTGATSDNFYVVGPSYTYFPQISQTVAVAADGATEIAASGKLNKNDTETTRLATANVPEAAVAEGATELTLSVNAIDATNEDAKTVIQTEKNNGRETANFDIKIDGIKADNSTPITLEVMVGKGLTNVTVYHNGDKIEGSSYDAETGMLTFTTTSFSDFTAAYDPVCARINGVTYHSLAEAIANAESGDTITMMRNVEAVGGISVPSGKSFTVDFAGYSYLAEKPGAGSAGTKTQAFQLLNNSSIIFKNGTIGCTEANKSATWDSASTVKGVAMVIQNYANLTLENMVIDGTNIAHNGSNVRYVLSNNCGTVLIDNTTIKAYTGDYAFDSCKSGSYDIPSVTVSGKSVIDGKVELSGGRLTVTDAKVAFKGEIEATYDYTDDSAITITAGSFADDISDLLPEDYEATLTDGVWQVAQETPKPYVMFVGSAPFDLSRRINNTTTKFKNDNTVYMEYTSTPEVDASWEKWDGSGTITAQWVDEGDQTKGSLLCLRGTGVTNLVNTTGYVYNSTSYQWKCYKQGKMDTFEGTVACKGNIENLLDYKTVLKGEHPTMDYGCCKNMFTGWTCLTSAPDLPAEALSEGCYYKMFSDCIKLKKAPDLPAEAMTGYCYYGMFQGCTSLVKAPVIDAASSAEASCYKMFKDCTNLKTAPCLPSPTGGDAYQSMFYGCTALKITTSGDSSHLVVTMADTTAVGRCRDMFYNCANAVTYTTGTGYYYVD